MPIYQVAVLQTNRDHFDYHSDDELIIGVRVWVPFRQSIKLGIIVGAADSQEMYPKLKSIEKALDHTAILSDDILKLCRWISQYYQSPLAQVLALALPKRCREGNDQASHFERYFELDKPEGEARQLINARAAKQQACISFVAKKKSVRAIELRDNGFSNAIISALLEKSILKMTLHPIQPSHSFVSLLGSPTLNNEQHEAFMMMLAQINHYHCFLLDGVTGSGKTEVYFQLITEILSTGKQVLILVPEIGLTPQLRQRFQERFSQPLTVIHSQMSDSERQQAWLWARDQTVKIVLGTRSALFTPMPNLGLIIIDEEHDMSLKQMEGVRYLARDAALMRAYFLNIPIVLGSATPSLESLSNASKGKYTRICLNHKALNQFPLHYQIVDLRCQKLDQGVAVPTHQAIERHLLAGNQVLIFINRRGFSPVLLCHTCAWKADCPHCDARLTVHKAANQLMCHHCGFQQLRPNHCPQCRSRELILMGAGTQRIEESLTLAFPQTAILRIDRDVVNKKQGWEHYWSQIQDGHAQLIVGTQMLAKGHHFSRLSLVVILDADYGFYDQDFRALERLGQLITQVSGRAGRADIPGEVVIQTHVPDHPLLNILIQKGYEPFANALLKEREEADLPPCSFMALMRVQGKNHEKILTFLHAIKTYLSTSGLVIMGPAPAPLSKKAGYYRMQLLMKSSSRQNLQRYLTILRAWLQSNTLSNGLRWNIDVDPMDLA